MRPRSLPLIPLFAGAMFLFLDVALPQAIPQQKPKMAEEVFKNIQALKGISVDDFLGTMEIGRASCRERVSLVV